MPDISKYSSAVLAHLRLLLPGICTVVTAPALAVPADVIEFSQQKKTPYSTILRYNSYGQSNIVFSSPALSRDTIRQKFPFVQEYLGGAWSVTSSINTTEIQLGGIVPNGAQVATHTIELDLSLTFKPAQIPARLQLASDATVGTSSWYCIAPNGICDQDTPTNTYIQPLNTLSGEFSLAPSNGPWPGTYALSMTANGTTFYPGTTVALGINGELSETHKFRALNPNPTTLQRIGKNMATTADRQIALAEEIDKALDIKSLLTGIKNNELSKEAVKRAAEKILSEGLETIPGPPNSGFIRETMEDGIETIAGVLLEGGKGILTAAQVANAMGNTINKTAKALGTWLAADPPDHNFLEVMQPRNILLPADLHSELGAQNSNYIENLLSAFDALSVSTTAAERYMGALEAGNLDAAMVQWQAFREFFLIADGHFAKARKIGFVTPEADIYLTDADVAAALQNLRALVEESPEGYFSAEELAFLSTLSVELVRSLPDVTALNEMAYLGNTDLLDQWLSTRLPEGIDPRPALAVPEPSAVLLVLVGVGTVCWRSRKRTGYQVFTQNRGFCAHAAPSRA